MFKILPEYGVTLSTLCPVNADCSWGSAVNVRNKFIYITQPEQNRVIVIEIQDRSNPVEVGVKQNNPDESNVSVTLSLDYLYLIIIIVLR